MSEPSTIDMRQAMVQVAEEAAYAFVDEPRALVDWPNEILVAQIEVHVPYCGELMLAAVPAWCAWMAASFEGHDEPQQESIAKRNDALGELLNIMCGILIGEEGNTTPRPSFGIPRVEVVERRRLDELLSIASRHVVLEAEFGHPIALLFVKNEGTHS